MPAVLRCLSTALLVALVPACNDVGPTASTATAPAADARAATQAQSEATARIGDVTIRASAVQTSMLAAASAQRYGIDQDARRVLLLVTLRRQDDNDARPVVAQVTAKVTNAKGSHQPLALHPLPQANPGQDTGATDYIGTIDISLPDTLRFDVRITTGNGDAAALHFSRDFYPR